MAYLQSLSDKQHNYFGSQKMFYLGSTTGSTSTWAFVNFSGTDTGFGAHGNDTSNRFLLASSGTSFVQWSWNSGTTLAGELYGGANITQDGVNRSGVWLRTNVASQGWQIWAW